MPCVAATALLLLATAAFAQRVPVEPPLRPLQHVEGYLLFDVVFHEQLNKQRRALMFFLDLALKLKRTLVLPRARVLRRTNLRGGFDPKADFVRMGELLNLSAFRQLHPVMDLEDYLAEHAEFDQHTSMGHGGCVNSDAPSTVEFSGLQVRAVKSTCEPMLPHQLPAMIKLHHVKSIAFSQSVNQMHPAQAIQLRPWVRFEQGVYDAAAAFVAKTFGTEPFVAIHWRRTDFLIARPKPGVLQSPAELMRHARALMEEHGVTRVYLATDNTDDGEMALVNAGLKPTRLEPPAEAAESLRARAVHANVEIAICAMADYFLGTQTSSFTLAITEERQAVFGHAAATGAEMGLKDAPKIERSARQHGQPHVAPTQLKDEL